MRDETFSADGLRIFGEFKLLLPIDRLEFVCRLPAADLGRTVRVFQLAFGNLDGYRDLNGVRLSQAINSTLVALSSFDRHFREIWGCSWHPYVDSDQAVEILCDIAEVDLGFISSSAILAVATGLGLIYRFDVARKYGYPPGATQIRASSWGREMTTRDSSALESVMGLVQDEKYRGVVALLEEEIRGETGQWANEIGALNARLRVGVLR